MKLFPKIVTNKIYLLFLKIPGINKYSYLWYKKLGVILDKNARISNRIILIGNYSNLILNKNSEINANCFFLAKDKIIIGENSTLAYQVTILTSSNPNGPINKLSKIYKKFQAPVKIGNNSWIGARAIILPGITVGNFCVVGAGSVVTKNVPDYSVVAGIPARVIKKLNPAYFN